MVCNRGRGEKGGNVPLGRAVDPDVFGPMDPDTDPHKSQIKDQKIKSNFKNAKEKKANYI